MAQDQEIRSIHLAAESDLVLQVGSPVVKALYVSSHVLIAYSKPFEALLTHGFREGRAQRSIDSPQIIPLPDDDPKAMKRLCAFLHGRVPKVFQRKLNEESVVALADIAKLVDKYECFDKMQFVSQSLLFAAIDGYQQGEIGSCRLKHIVDAAYLLRHDRCFELATKHLIMDRVHTCPVSMEDDRIPSEVHDAIDLVRYKAREMIAYELPDHVDDMDFICDVLSGDVQWPGKRMAVVDVINSLKSIDHEPEIHDAKEFVEDLEDVCMGLCLRCIRRGKVERRAYCEDDDHC